MRGHWTLVNGETQDGSCILGACENAPAKGKTGGGGKHSDKGRSLGERHESLGRGAGGVRPHCGVQAGGSGAARASRGWW